MRLRSLCVVLLASASFSQTVPDGKAILNEAAKALRDAHSYVIEHEVVVEMKGGLESRLVLPVKLAVSNPAKLRIESNGQLGSTLIVSDGEHTWMYLGRWRQYTKTPAASNPEALMKSINSGIGQMLDEMRAKDPYLSAQVTGEETLEVDGKEYDCYVVKATLDKIGLPGAMKFSDGVMTSWVDKKTNVTLKQTTIGTVEAETIPTSPIIQSTIVKSFKLNEPIADSLFTFTPPAGATEVAEFQGAVKANPDLTGKLAADFKLKSLDEKEYRLADLHGKVVLLDFWATWCIPCRNDLPALQKIQQDFQSPDLVMLGMNVGEARDTVGKFLSTTKLNYPVVLAGDAEIVQSYSVTAFPTVVLIDPEGRIALYHVGAGADKQLRAAMAKLGLSTNSGKNAQ